MTTADLRGPEADRARYERGAAVLDAVDGAGGSRVQRADLGLAIRDCSIATQGAQQLFPDADLRGDFRDRALGIDHQMSSIPPAGERVQRFVLPGLQRARAARSVVVPMMQQTAAIRIDARQIPMARDAAGWP